MQITVLDAKPLDDGDLDWAPLRAMGQVTLHSGTSTEELAARIGDADVLYTNKVPLRATVFDAAPRLKLISVLATGYDIIDISAARAHGVTVCNVPAYSTASTAQTTIALLLELCHRAGAHSDAVHAGEWSRSPTFSFWKHPLTDLGGKTLLIVGLGAIGRRVATIAGALGMKIIAAQLPGREAAAHSEFARLPLDEALPVADVVSLHCPMTPQTRGLIDAERLAKFRTGALLINAARGPIVDDLAVRAALETGRLAGFAADVLASEPPPADHPLFGAPNCILTPHIAWATPDSRRRNLEISVQNLRAFLDGTPQNVVS
ncbi:MAG: D-2-hydroxyacid dehydrogenase [Fibrella sp.]|nr:D-2-hydroxyacid dehydrogenase [Armatimonadota bacterium]